MAAASIRRNAPTSLNVKDLHKKIDDVDDYNVKIFLAARWYAENGFLIVPFMPYGYPKGLSQRHASKSVAKIEEWWHPNDGLYPGAAIAMAHGGQSGFCAIDLDKKADVDGMMNLADLQAAYGGYSDGEGEGIQTLMAITPSGGRHLIFRYHPEIISNSEFSYPGIDTRGGLKSNPIENGGITFVEPSKKPKGSGFYRWDETVTNIIDMPQWLVDVLNGRKPKSNTGIRLQESYVQSASGEHGEGRDRNIYMDLMRFVGIGYTEEQLWALMPDILQRMDPPDEAMVRRKIESAIASDAYKKAQTEGETRKHTDSLDLDKSEKGAILRTAKNLSTILKSPLFEYEFGVIEYDDFYQRFTIDKRPISMVADYSVGIQMWMSRKLLVDFGAQNIRATIEYIAFVERKHSNAARDYMVNCPVPPENYPRQANYWGSGRKGPGLAFSRLCTEVLKFTEPLHTEYDDSTREAYEGFLWFWLQGVALRACIPGCKMEIMINIFGSQGIGKSTFFRELCPNPAWFTDSVQDSIVNSGQDNKDELSKLHAKLIVELPELSPLKRGGKAADDKIKQFLSAMVDEYRRSYGQDIVSHPRTCGFGGTANNNDVYRDITGDRRFVSINHGSVPIAVGDMDTGVMKDIRDNLWGEVISSFNPGELDKPANAVTVVIPHQLREYQNQINNNHRYEEIGLNDVIEWMQDKSRITWQEIIEYARSIPGMRDAKESSIMITIRQSLRNNDQFQFKKRITRSVPGGNATERVNCWVNYGLASEQEHKAGMAVPKHWSDDALKQSEY